MRAAPAEGERRDGAQKVRRLKGVRTRKCRIEYKNNGEFARSGAAGDNAEARGRGVGRELPMDDARRRARRRAGGACVGSARRCGLDFWI